MWSALGRGQRHPGDSRKANTSRSLPATSLRWGLIQRTVRELHRVKLGGSKVCFIYLEDHFY